MGDAMIELSPEDRKYLINLACELRNAPRTIDPKCEDECREVVTFTSLVLGQICERLEKIACVQVTLVDWNKYILGIPPWDEATLRKQGEEHAVEAGRKWMENLEADLIKAIAGPPDIRFDGWSVMARKSDNKVNPRTAEEYQFRYDTTEVIKVSFGRPARVGAHADLGSYSELVWLGANDGKNKVKHPNSTR